MKGLQWMLIIMTLWAVIRLGMAQNIVGVATAIVICMMGMRYLRGRL